MKTLTPAEAALLLRVNTITLRRWETKGKLTTTRTPGGHRRYREDEVHALLHGDAPARPAPAQQQYSAAADLDGSTLRHAVPAAAGCVSAAAACSRPDRGVWAQPLMAGTTPMPFAPDCPRSCLACVEAVTGVQPR